MLGAPFRHGTQRCFPVAPLADLKLGNTAITARRRLPSTRIPTQKITYLQRADRQDLALSLPGATTVLPTTTSLQVSGTRVLLGEHAQYTRAAPILAPSYHHLRSTYCLLLHYV